MPLLFNQGTDNAQIALIPTVIIPVPNNDPLIRIFPNPATNQVNITSTTRGFKDIRIVDLTGQLVYHQGAGTATHITIYISLLSASVYMVNLKAWGRQYHNRFVKISAK